MPAEEMDIITDVSHSGPAEDIDLDLDDAVAHTDDDMELGDYNEQQGAMDAVDEMMAEGDETSDGMVDADEIDYNVSGVANSDYDIDIGGTDGNPYEMENVGQNVDISLGDEIEYAVDTEPTGLANEQTATDEDWLQDQNLAGVVTAEGDVTQMEDTPIEEGDQAPVSQDVQAATITAESAEAAVLPVATHAEVHRNEATKGEQQRNEPAESGHIELQNLGEDFQNEESHHEPAETGPGESAKDQFTDQNNNAPSTLPAESDYQSENLVALTSATPGGVELSGDDNVDGAVGAVPVTNDAEVINVSETTETLEASWGEQAEETAETGEHYNDVESSEVAKIREVSEVQTNGDAEARAGSSHDFPVENEKPLGSGAEETHSHENPSGDHSNPVVGTVEEDVDADVDNHSQSSRLPHTQITASEHPSAIAARYEILINYGKMDYQLFAKSVDDDPEQYFLSDRSALDTSLLEFLASIRDVITQEVSPLDELVMHIDGLGLEFGETTTRDFVERYTFGDMLVLYDKLIKNEDTNDTPELYVYLLVKPNCSQRLAALVDQANSGRGFSDVAVYRDATPAQDDEVPHGEGKILAISPDVAVDEFFEDFDEEEEDSNQEQEAVENQGPETVEDQEQDTFEHQQQDAAENRQREPVGNQEEDSEYQEQGATEYHEQEAAEYREQETAEYYEQETVEYHEQETAEDPEQEVTEYHEQETAEYQEQEPFEFEMQEGVEQHEHNEFDEITLRHEGGADNQDYGGFSEQRAPADTRDTLESTPAVTAPAEMTQALDKNADEPTRAEDVDLSNYDDNEDGLDVGPAQDDHTDVVGVDSTLTKGEGAAASDGQVVDASSHNTSATATLNGDENDEIDYSDGEAEVDAKPHETITSATSQEQADGDYIWESEDEEDTREETVVTPPKQSAQVSPTTGKRVRSGSDAAENAEAHASVRRRLS